MSIDYISIYNEYIYQNTLYLECTYKTRIILFNDLIMCININMMITIVSAFIILLRMYYG